MSEPFGEEFQEYQRWKAQQQARSTEDLIQEALAHPEDEGPYHPLMVLHLRGTDEVFARARDLCRSVNVSERELGVDILAQLDTPKDTYADASVAILLAMIEGETAPDVLSSLAYALGHRHDPRAIRYLVKLREHPEPCVRGGVVFGLLGYEDDAAIAALIALSADSESTVRDWATFGLGSMIDTDTPEIRAALYARVTDDDADTRAEGIDGLLKRRDPRCVDVILAALADSDRCGTLILEAARDLEDHRLYPALLAIQVACVGDDTIAPFWLSRLQQALDACRP